MDEDRVRLRVCVSADEPVSAANSIAAVANVETNSFQGARLVLRRGSDVITTLELYDLEVVQVAQVGDRMVAIVPQSPQGPMMAEAVFLAFEVDADMELFRDMVAVEARVRYGSIDPRCFR